VEYHVAEGIMYELQALQQHEEPVQDDSDLVQATPAEDMFNAICSKHLNVFMGAYSSVMLRQGQSVQGKLTCC
jgi:hypothetical protein